MIFSNITPKSKKRNNMDMTFHLYNQFISVCYSNLPWQKM